MRSRRIPCLTAEQMAEVDRAMVEDYGITLVQMMENAGGQLAAEMIRRANISGDGKKIVFNRQVNGEKNTIGIHVLQLE